MNIFKQITSFIIPFNIERRKGKYTPFLEVNLKNGQYILDGKNVNYSFGSLHSVFMRALSHYKIKKRPIKNVLILGFGAGSVAHILRYGYKLDCFITGVEKDPVVLELGLKYFGVEKYKKLKLICDDAIDFVANDISKYDLIVIDVFIEDNVPEIFHTNQFLRGVKVLLDTGGIVLFNKVTQSSKQQSEAIALVNTMTDIFGSVEVLKMTQNSVENSVIVYSDNIPKNEIFSLKHVVQKSHWFESKITTI